MSLLVMSLGHKFCASRKGGIGEGGEISTMGPGNMVACGISCRISLVGTGWATSLLLCTNGLRKRPSGDVGLPFLVVKLVSCSVGTTIGQEP